MLYRPSTLVASHKRPRPALKNTPLWTDNYAADTTCAKKRNMPITVDLKPPDPSADRLPPGAAPTPADRPLRLLFLLNPGRVSRHYLQGLVNAACRIGIAHRTLELAEVWRRKRVDINGLTHDMAALLRSENIGAVCGYVHNGTVEFRGHIDSFGRKKGFFPAMGIPHLMLWTDHPQWAEQKAALDPRMQPCLNSSYNHHFLKSEAAAAEIKGVLGWPNCHGLPVAEDALSVKPQPQIQPQHDVVAILGSPPHLDERLKPFLDHDDPDVDAIMDVVNDTVHQRLHDLWRRDVPQPRWDAFDRFGRAWAQRRRADVRTASVRHLAELLSDYRDQTEWLVAHPRTYFDAIEHLWLFGAWQRAFYLLYLARYFRVAVYGADWTSAGLGGGDWVDYHDQAATYARGKIAINISQGSEEEGISHKPFQIAASGVPMVHIDRKGLAECFEPGTEVEVFQSPGDARRVIQALLDDPGRRAAMAAAARSRLERCHTWEHRLRRMLDLANLQIAEFLPGTVIKSDD